MRSAVSKKLRRFEAVIIPVRYSSNISKSIVQSYKEGGYDVDKISTDINKCKNYSSLSCRSKLNLRAMSLMRLNRVGFKLWMFS